MYDFYMHRLQKNTTKYICLILTVCTALIFNVEAAHADDVKRLGVFNDWTAFMLTEGERSSCYMSSQPKTYVPKDKNRHGDVGLFVAHFPGETQKHEVSLTVGYNWHANADVIAQIGKQRFEMMIEGKSAWALNPDDQDKLITALRRGATATISGKSRKGTTTRYSFSLTGFTKAHNAINKACGVKY